MAGISGYGLLGHTQACLTTISPLEPVLPIPEYETASNEKHVQLSRLGRKAEQECKALLDKLVALNVEDWLTSTNARSNLRNGWQPGSPTAQAIEEAVGELLAGGQA